MEYMNGRSPSTPAGELSSAGSISLNKGESIDAYKEKIEHFKVLVVHLQNELQSNKMRKEGAETVSKLLQESKKEVIVLQKKIKTLESVIRNLQSRLELHGLSTEINLQEGETYIPSHSKQLLDNLTRENTRLRGLIRNTSGDPEELDRLRKVKYACVYIWASTRENLSSATDKCADQPAHLRSLICAFVIRLLESIISKLGTSVVFNFLASQPSRLV